MPRRRTQFLLLTPLLFAISCTNRYEVRPPLVGGPAPRVGNSAHHSPQMPVAGENKLAGTSAWRLDKTASTDIEGFASKTSFAPGETAQLFVRTGSPSFDMTVYRLGWYAGLGGREISPTKHLTASSQPECKVLAATLTTDCSSWRPSATISIGSSWASGLYLAKLQTPAHDESYVPFVVRETHPHASILVQCSVTTWQAYNLWGGRDLYRGPKPARPASTLSKGAQQGGRALAVSFDRPYEWPGAGLAYLETPFMFWAESKGWDLAYATDIDLHQGLDALAQRKIFVSLGHDEYYSTAMRKALEQALAAGTSLVFLGGNDIYRHIRMDASHVGADRIEINYRIARDDPEYAVDPLAVTTQWREPPLNDPEQKLLGAQWDDGGVNADWIASGEPAWLFRGSGLRAGDHVTHLVGFEYDRVFKGVPHPPGVVLVSRSHVQRHTESNSTFYVAPSGAGVFDAGSLWFDCALGPGCHERSLVPEQDPRPKVDKRVVEDQRIQQLIGNLIRAMLKRSFA